MQLMIGRGVTDSHLLPHMANRHGLIAGATGTGKTVTLRVMAERFSSIGVPVFMADVKGDLSGIARATADPEIIARATDWLKLTDYQPQAFPVAFWDLLGIKGHPVRAMVHNLGPYLMSRLMNLNQVQQGVMVAAWKMAADRSVQRGKQVGFVDITDLQLALKELSDHASKYSIDYGNINFASVGAIQRALLEMRAQGVNQFFNAPELDTKDFFTSDQYERGCINILQADTIIKQPKLYSTFLLWMLSELYVHR